MSDLEWELIKCVLPNKSRGVKRVDDRRAINSIFYALWVRCDLPDQYDAYTTAYNRFNRWSYAGIWDKMMEAVADTHNAEILMVDGTSDRIHHAATTLKKTILCDAWCAFE
jgi:transposase